MKKRYLITGGLGFIGQAITQDLVQKKNFVTVIDNNFKNKKFPNLDKKYCKVFIADIRKKASLKKIIKNYPFLWNFLVWLKNRFIILSRLKDVMMMMILFQTSVAGVGIFLNVLGVH